jgi:hypothetical protein
MRRALSEAEKVYIMDNYQDEDVQDMANKMHGVGTKTIQKYVDELPPTPVQGETTQERQRKLQSTKVSGSKLMGRDKEKGVTVMTEAASELIDARKVLATPEKSDAQKKAMKDKIHRPFEESPYDR